MNNVIKIEDFKKLHLTRREKEEKKIVDYLLKLHDDDLADMLAKIFLQIKSEGNEHLGHELIELTLNVKKDRLYSQTYDLIEKYDKL